MAIDEIEDTGLTDDKSERPSAVRAMVEDALVRLRLELGQPGLKIAELERLRGLPRGTIASPLKPVNRGSRPRRETIRTLATALNIDFAKLGDAFWADYMGDEDPKTIHQQRAADLIGELPTHLQDLGIRQLEVLVEHHRACAAALSQDASTPAT